MTVPICEEQEDEFEAHAVGRCSPPLSPQRQKGYLHPTCLTPPEPRRLSRLDIDHNTQRLTAVGSVH
jgi:hypothetical protein